MTRLVTAREAAEELGVAERTVRRWISAGELPAEKRGGVFAIDVPVSYRYRGEAQVMTKPERFGVTQLPATPGVSRLATGRGSRDPFRHGKRRFLALSNVPSLSVMAWW